MRTTDYDSLKISRDPKNDYGSLEGVIRGIRAHRPLDLNAERWHEANSGGDFETWREEAHACLMEGLHYDPGSLDLQAEVLDREERDGFILEEVAFNTTPWIRVTGFFLLPTGVDYPVPGLVVFHAWGGPMLFGKERIVNTGRDHPTLVSHRDDVYSGRYLAEEIVRAGYAVIVIDAFHFGERAPRGFGGIPDQYDPFELVGDEWDAVHRKVREQLALGVRQLNWAGTTWMGLNYWDDSRCVDYLMSREEVDYERIGCTGLSGGGWRTNILAALDLRVKASVGVGWMTTGDYQQVYNVGGAIGTFCQLPGVWDRIDVQDLAIMRAPQATMVVSCLSDPLFPPEGQHEAARQIQAGFEWAGNGDQFYSYMPNKKHCYDAEIQAEAIEWLDRYLK